jgi:predicted acyl esterase
LALNQPLHGRIFDVKANYDKQEDYIPMRYGIKLFTAIYTPKDKSRKYATLLNRTPYGIAPYGENQFPVALRPGEAYAIEGFIFVFQDVRGNNKSEGDVVNITPHKPIKNSKSDVDETSMIRLTQTRMKMPSCEFHPTY